MLCRLRSASRGWPGTEILRCAQDDMLGKLTPIGLPPSAYWALRNRTSPTATTSCGPAARGAKFCLTHSAAHLVDSSACSCVSKKLMVKPSSSPTCIPAYSTKPGQLLIIGTNPFPIRRTPSSINPGFTLIRRIATYIACLLSFTVHLGELLLP